MDSEDIYKKWRVKYEGEDYDLSLALQISEKGQAVKLVK